MSQGLYDFLVETGDYSKSFNEFQSQFSNAESKQKLHEHMLGKGSYTKTWMEFQNQFFPTEIAVTTPTTTTPATTTPKTTSTSELSEEENKQLQNSAVDRNFWLERNDSRERYYKDENGDWVGPPVVSKFAKVASNLSYDSGLIKAVKVEDEEILKE